MPLHHLARGRGSVWSPLAALFPSLRLCPVPAVPMLALLVLLHASATWNALSTAQRREGHECETAPFLNAPPLLPPSLPCIPAEIPDAADGEAAPDAAAAAATAPASAAAAATGEVTVNATAPQSKSVLACLAAAARVSAPLEEAFLASLMAGELELKSMKKKKKRARTAEEAAAEGEGGLGRSFDMGPGVDGAVRDCTWPRWTAHGPIGLHMAPSD